MFVEEVCSTRRAQLIHRQNWSYTGVNFEAFQTLGACSRDGVQREAWPKRQRHGFVRLATFRLKLAPTPLGPAIQPGDVAWLEPRWSLGIILAADCAGIGEANVMFAPEIEHTKSSDVTVLERHLLDHDPRRERHFEGHD